MSEIGVDREWAARSAREPGPGAEGEEGVREDPEEGEETEIGIKDAVEKIQ